ncbi:hypothetical protein PR202_gb28674 [Eleusine coracana subsp. coracana]|uniref:Uncharacterized protein n=1 Tax=Eleusine coracana subsp. coracana TaxID=191504 RepID=A0AAV5FV55_ELECO|nr:hypothetical protein PR202_gb28674 [Eleusine coracana subsp. coracana]
MSSIDDGRESLVDHASSSLVEEFFDFRANDNEDLLDSLIRLRGIVDRIATTSFELPKIVIVEKILSLLLSNKLFYITLDLVMEENLSVEDVIELLFKDEEITARGNGKKSFKANNEASSSKGKEVALSSNFFDPSTRLRCNSFYNPFKARPSSRSSPSASSISTSSDIPSSTPSTSGGSRIGVGGAPTTMLTQVFEMINLTTATPTLTPPQPPPPQDHLWHLR